MTVLHLTWRLIIFANRYQRIPGPGQEGGVSARRTFALRLFMDLLVALVALKVGMVLEEEF